MAFKSEMFGDTAVICDAEFISLIFHLYSSSILNNKLRQTVFGVMLDRRERNKNYNQMLTL